MATENQVRLMF